MAGKKFYKDYFNIDPKYYAAVTADLIESGHDFNAEPIGAGKVFILMRHL